MAIMAYLDPNLRRQPKPWPYTPSPESGGFLKDSSQSTNPYTQPPPNLDTSAVRGRLAKDTPISTTQSSGLNELGRLRAQQSAIEKAPQGYEVKPMKGETGPEWQTVPRKHHGRKFEALMTGLEGAAQAASNARPGQEIGAVIGGFGTGAAMGAVSPKFRAEYEKQRAEAQVSAKIEAKQQQELNQARIADTMAQATQRAQGTGKIIKGGDGQEYVVYGDQAKPIKRTDTGADVMGAVPAEKTVKVGPYLYELHQGKWSLAKGPDGQPIKDTSKPDMIPVKGKDGREYQLSQKQAFDYVNGSEVTLPNGEKVRLTPGQLATYESGQQKVEVEAKKAKTEAEEYRAAADDATRRGKEAGQQMEEARQALKRVTVPKRIKTGTNPNSGAPIYEDNPDYSQADVDYYREQLKQAQDYQKETQKDLAEANRKLQTASASANARTPSTSSAKPSPTFINAFKKKNGRAPTQQEIDAYAAAANR